MAKYIVRHGGMRILGLFEANAKRTYSRSDSVIVRTDRGLEAGKVLCDAEGANLEEVNLTQIGQILREMTASDKREVQRIAKQRDKRFEICQRSINKLSLDMDLVDVEHIFGGERIIVYYLAEGRVDFRELVKMLAGEFQTRIEMRQIGVRDEAKLLADYGDCGKPVCCNTHLSVMPPVSMKMAKMQKATLDPNKISGRCGRLKCCLRFEFDVYEELHKKLPPLGARVEIDGEEFRVLNQEILTESVLVEAKDNTRKYVCVSEIDKVLPYKKRPKSTEQPADDEYSGNFDENSSGNGDDDKQPRGRRGSNNNRSRQSNNGRGSHNSNSEPSSEKRSSEE